MLTWLIATVALYMMLQTRPFVTAEPDGIVAGSEIDDGAILLALIPVVVALVLIVTSTMVPELATLSPGIGLQ